MSNQSNLKTATLVVKRHFQNPTLMLVDAVCSTPELALKRRQHTKEKLGDKWEVWVETYNYYTKDDW